MWQNPFLWVGTHPVLVIAVSAVALTALAIWKMFTSAMKKLAEPQVESATRKMIIRLGKVPGIRRPVRIIFGDPAKVDSNSIVPDASAVANPPPFPGHDYVEDALDGIRWRWHWREYENSEPEPTELHAYCPGDDCDYEMRRTESGLPKQRETLLTCPSCQRMWNRMGYWADILQRMVVIIQRNRRTGGRGDGGLVRFSEETK